jgi:Domain of unknown function (DUF4126)
VEGLLAVGRTVPFALASGLNLYATVALLGLCSRYDLVALPPQFRGFEHLAVITVALVLYAIEFVADKIPWVDSAWDAIHTIIRPLGGAFVAVTALGQAAAPVEALAALVGGSVAMTGHLGKAGTRAVANASPEPFSNWVLSFAEDLLAVGMTYLAMRHPVAAVVFAAVVLAIIVAFASVLVRALRKRLGRPKMA